MFDFLTVLSILFTVIVSVCFLYIQLKIMLYIWSILKGVVDVHCKSASKKSNETANEKGVGINYKYSYVEEEDIPLLENVYAFNDVYSQPLYPTTVEENTKKNSYTYKNATDKEIEEKYNRIKKNTYWLSRVLIIRMLGLVYCSAFLVVALQGRPLVGVKGLTPVPLPPEPKKLPLQGWFFLIFGFNNRALEILGWLGFIISLFMASGRISSPVIAFVLWALYESFYFVSHLPGVRFFHYGWDFQLLETGFLAIFLCPITSQINAFFYASTSSSKYDSNSTPILVLMLFRWLGFRLMLGAGLSKIMASETCWKYSNLDCMAHFYETTGNPSPLAWLLHKSPIVIHYLEVLANHFVELVLPWLFLSPWRSPRHFAGVIQILFQVVLILGGNYAFLNHLTIVPCLSLFDDAFILKYLEYFFPSTKFVSYYTKKIIWLQKDEGVVDVDRKKNDSKEKRKIGGAILCFNNFFAITKRYVIPTVLSCFILIKSRPALEDLFSSHPWLNTFDSYCFVNSYGVFGSITKKRYDMTLKYTHDPLKHILKVHKKNIARGGIDNEVEINWKELPFRCKADVPTKWPCVTSPYYHRLDWETWIDVTAIGEYDTTKKTPDYIVTLIGKILHGDKDAASLLRVPLSELYTGKDEDEPPTAIVPTFYLYEYSNISDLLYYGKWWKQKKRIQSGILYTQKLFRNFIQTKNDIEDEISPARDSALMFLCISIALSYIETFLLDKTENSIWKEKGNDKIRINVALSVALLLTFTPNFTCSFCSALLCLYCSYKITVKFCQDVSSIGKVSIYRHTNLFVLLACVNFSIWKNLQDFDNRDYD